VNREVFSDRVNKNKFYILDASTKTLYRSRDGGVSFTAANTAIPTSSWYWPTLTVSYAAEGDLWFTSDTGLYHSTDSGATFTKISGVQTAYSIGLGKAASGQSYPALYLSAQINNVKGLYRSVDAGATWIRINDDLHQYGGISSVTGDPRIFGRVYFGGRGVMYGDSAN
jgi:xyloglucan-specific exo-beta-1,4-glucanase